MSKANDHGPSSSKPSSKTTRESAPPPSSRASNGPSSRAPANAKGKNDRTWQSTLPLVLLVVGAVAAVHGVLVDPKRTWLNLLLNGFYLLSLAVSATFFLAVQRLSGSRWSAGLRRIPEAFMSIVPVGAALMLVVFLAGRTIYPWNRPDAFVDAPAIAGKVTYLSVPFVLARVAVALTLWLAFAWVFRKTSLEQDANPNRSLLLHKRLNRYAAFFVLVFAPMFTLSAYDAIISLDPEWFSTMFGVYVFAGTFVQGMAAITLVVAILKDRGSLGSAVKDNHLHDLGKLLFAFSTFWAYIWICQYLLIWYGNIPEEAGYYVARTKGPWLFVFVLNFIVNWVTPFITLLSSRTKGNTKVLRAISVVLLFGHWLDLYLLIMPSASAVPKIGPVEVLVAAAHVAIAYFLVKRCLGKAPLVPVNDPILMANRMPMAHDH